MAPQEDVGKGRWWPEVMPTSGHITMGPLFYIWVTSGDTGGEEGHMVTGWGAWKLTNDARNHKFLFWRGKHQTIKPLEETLHQEQD